MKRGSAWSFWNGQPVRGVDAVTSRFPGSYRSWRRSNYPKSSGHAPGQLRSTETPPPPATWDNPALCISDRDQGRRSHGKGLPQLSGGRTFMMGRPAPTVAHAELPRLYEMEAFLLRRSPLGSIQGTLWPPIKSTSKGA